MFDGKDILQSIKDDLIKLYELMDGRVQIKLLKTDGTLV